MEIEETAPVANTNSEVTLQDVTTKALATGAATAVAYWGTTFLLGALSSQVQKHMAKRAAKKTED